MTTEDILDWTGIPHTDNKAEPTAWHDVALGQLVIKVTNAEIRGASISGYLLVAKTPTPRSTFNEDWRIEVECLWYGKKPKTSWMHLTVNNGFEFLNDYEGEVISNIGG